MSIMDKWKQLDTDYQHVDLELKKIYKIKINNKYVLTKTKFNDPILIFKGTVIDKEGKGGIISGLYTLKTDKNGVGNETDNKRIRNFTRNMMINLDDILNKYDTEEKVLKAIADQAVGKTVYVEAQEGQIYKGNPQYNWNPWTLSQHRAEEKTNNTETEDSDSLTDLDF